MTVVHRRAPAWFRIVAVLLIVWGVAGCYACFQQFRLGAEAMGPATDYERALYASLPLWFNPIYAVATVSGLLGALALLARSRFAFPLFCMSFSAIVLQFGYLFLTSDLIAYKGAFAAAPPLAITLIAGAAAQLSRNAHARGWIG